MNQEIIILSSEVKLSQIGRILLLLSRRKYELNGSEQLFATSGALAIEEGLPLFTLACEISHWSRKCTELRKVMARRRLMFGDHLHK